MEQVFKKYMKNYGGLLLGGIVAIFGIFIFLIYLSDDMNNMTMGLIIMLFFVIMGILCIIRCIMDVKQIDKIISNNVESSSILSEFKNAENVLDGELRLGQNYLFGHKSNRVIKYSEINQIYIRIHKIKNGVEKKRELFVVDEKGKKLILCKLRLNGKNDEEAKKVMLFIKIKNPSAELGYHK